jgi:translocation and assembly module TamB
MRWILLVLVLCLPFAAQAQSDDRGYLTALLEDNLSGAGRKVTITGFQGALSSKASLTEMTIADDEGVWLTLRNVVLDWNRSALLGGRLSVNALTAEEIIVARPPVTGGGAPSPEATAFALPDLPVSVEIGQLAAQRLELGAPVLGTALTARIEAVAVLDDGEGGVTLKLERTDTGPAGRVELNASYANETRLLLLNLSASEAAGGIASQLIGLPGTPAVDLTITGTGPIDNYAADIRLATDGTERLAGKVTLKSSPATGQHFTATLAGDVAPMFLPEYAEFFGTDVRLDTEGVREPSGRLDLRKLGLVTRAVTLDGALVLGADGLPERVALSGRVALADGGPVLLPLSTDQQTRIQGADLTLAYDKAAGEGWSGRARVTGLDRADFKAETVELTGSGRIRPNQGAAVIGGTLRFAAEGLLPADPGLATALGPAVTGDATLFWQQGGDGLRLPRLSLAGTGYALDAAGTFGGFDTGFDVSGRVTAQVDDLSRLAQLAGRPLSGAGTVTASGSGKLLEGSFDVEADVAGTDLAAGIAELDGLLRGPSRITLSAKRDTQGTLLRNLDITATSLSANASGTVATAGSDIRADLAFDDLSVLGPAYRGALTGQARFTGTPEAGQISLDANGTSLAMGIPEVDALLRGPSRIRLVGALDQGALDLREFNVTAATLKADATGRLDPEGSDVTANLDFSDLSALGGAYRGALTAEARFTGNPDQGRLLAEAVGTNLAIGQPEADRLLAGRSELDADLTLDGGRIKVNAARMNNPQLRADASGSVEGARRDVTLSARLANLGLLLPEFPGALTVEGTATDDGSGYQVNLTANGPGQIALRSAGRLATDFSSANITLDGSAQAALANAFLAPRTVSGPVRFDLRLNGPLTLQSLSGRVSVAGARIADPELGFALQGTDATVDLAGGRAQIRADAQGTAGGRLTVGGGVGLTAPFDGDLTVTLERVVLRDPELFQTTGSGAITLRGPLTGGAQIAGRISLEETELRIPSTGLGGAGALADLRHVNEPGAVRATRARAGLIETGGGGSGATGRPFGLDLTISAPNRVFVRGRGLDAELGGELRLVGTTNAIVPSGAFELIRGRLDILGKRLNLSEALLQMEGDFIPRVRIVASNESDGIVSSVVIEGQATEPQVGFSSSPELPEEEVLSRLLFGRGLTSLSALQAAQLAGAVATLAGRGGDGIVSKLRKGFGLDDLDLVTDAEGETSIRAGKYISQNVYTEVEVDQQGQSQINLNLDLTPSVTLRGSTGTSGETGIGIFIEKDY